jgi:hypothetical protein
MSIDEWANGESSTKSSVASCSIIQTHSQKAAEATKIQNAAAKTPGSAFFLFGSAAMISFSAFPSTAQRANSIVLHAVDPIHYRGEENRTPGRQNT